MAALAASLFVSIFATEILLALALVAFAARLVLGRARLRRTPLDGPLIAFCVWSLLSASFSTDPVVSHEYAKKLLLFALFYLALDTFTSEGDRERVLVAVFTGGLALAGLIATQHVLMGFDTLQSRPRGFLGHYMSASGLCMGVAILAAARLASAGERPRLTAGDARCLAALVVGLVLVSAAQAGGNFGVLATRLFVLALVLCALATALARGPWPAPTTATTLAALVLPLSSYAVIASQTRNAWLGAFVGLAVVAGLRAPRLLWVLSAAAVLLVLAPAVSGRLAVDESTRDRYYMWQAGLDMVADKPVFGQGPGMILTTYPQYRWAEAPNPKAPHLHNNALQLAAERGLPCLAFWLWWVAAALADAWRESRRPGPSAWYAAASLAVLVAVLVAGLFEYNFGDSEVLMFVLLVSSLPYALRRQRASA